MVKTATYVYFYLFIYLFQGKYIYTGWGIVNMQLKKEESVVQSGWRLVASSVPEGVSTGSILFYLPRDLDDGIKCNLSKFADVTKL